MDLVLAPSSTFPVTDVDGWALQNRHNVITYHDVVAYGHKNTIIFIGICRTSTFPFIITEGKVIKQETIDNCQANALIVARETILH